MGGGGAAQRTRTGALYTEQEEEVYKKRRQQLFSYSLLWKKKKGSFSPEIFTKNINANRNSAIRFIFSFFVWRLLSFFMWYCERNPFGSGRTANLFRNFLKRSLNFFAHFIPFFVTFSLQIFFYSHCFHFHTKNFFPVFKLLYKKFLKNFYQYICELIFRKYKIKQDFSFFVFGFWYFSLSMVFVTIDLT